MDILLQDFQTPFDTVPFSNIDTTQFTAAVKIALESAQDDIDAITNNNESATFDNTIAALDYSGQKLGRVSRIFFNLNSAETNDNLQSQAAEIGPILTAFQNDIIMNSGLFARIKRVYNNRDQQEYSSEERILLEKTYKRFVRNGALLNNVQQAQLRAIDNQLSQSAIEFGRRVLADTNAFEMHLTNESDVQGLPEREKQIASFKAEKAGKTGWLITLDYPSYRAFMTYATNRSLREKLYKAFSAQGAQANENNTEELVLKISKLRLERSKLLGYDSYAHFVLENRMAETPENAMDFLENLRAYAKPAAIREFDQLHAFTQSIGGPEILQSWDFSFYAEKLKQKLFDFDSEALKPYFPIEQVVDGLFEIIQRLYDLRFERNENIDVYHKDVKAYEVRDGKGELTAILYTDFFPRPGKRAGAWATSYKTQYRQNGINERPHASVVCNFSEPSGEQTSLLSFREVSTLFHEFGHALHNILAQTTFPGLSGTSVAWDFVELPSQIFENWCYEREALAIFAKHYQTGEDIPLEIVEKIKASGNFLEGIQFLRQLSLAKLDLSWHNKTADKIKSVKDHETEVIKDMTLFPKVNSVCTSTGFSHIFQGGYAAGYYSYKWAEVLDADAYDYFKSKGIFNLEVALKFKTLLSLGGTEKPAVLYKNFRGRSPKTEPLLKRAGLI